MFPDWIGGHASLGCGSIVGVVPSPELTAPPAAAPAPMADAPAPPAAVPLWAPAAAPPPAGSSLAEQAIVLRAGALMPSARTTRREMSDQSLIPVSSGAHLRSRVGAMRPLS